MQSNIQDMSDFGTLKCDPIIAKSVELAYLIDISNGMGLSEIEPHRPHKFDLNGVVDFKKVGDDLISRVKEAKKSLVRHFEHQARTDPDFKPYWKGDSSFVETYNQFTIPFRKYFENRLDYMERAGLTEKARFARPLSYFDSFYKRKGISDIAKSEKIDINHSNFPEYAIGSGLFFLGSGMMELFSSLEMQIIIGVLSGSFLGGGLLINYERRNSLQTNFSRLIDEPLRQRARIADKTIYLLQN